MNLKKIASAFLLSTVLSVFSCSFVFLWSEFSSHILTQNENCLADQHCIDECSTCAASFQSLSLNKALPDENIASLDESLTLDPLSIETCFFEVSSKNIAWDSPPPLDTNEFTYYGPHKIVENVVIIV